MMQSGFIQSILSFCQTVTVAVIMEEWSHYNISFFSVLVFPAAIIPQWVQAWRKIN